MSTWRGAASGTDRFLYGFSALNLTCPLADVPLTSLYRMGRPRGMDFIRRGEDNVFMDVSYTLAQVASFVELLSPHTKLNLEAAL